ncbi:MAG: Holliday junction resolvase RuvX, partial [Succinivibrio sp.]
PDQNSLDKLVKQWCPSVIVVGLPLNMDGSEQEMTFKARKFGNRLKEKYRISVVFEDERLTSCDAKDEIFSSGGFKALKKDKGAIDSLSATLILQQYMDSNP